MGGKGGGQTTTQTQNFSPEQLGSQRSLFGAAGDYFFGPLGNPYNTQSSGSPSISVPGSYAEGDFMKYPGGATIMDPATNMPMRASAYQQPVPTPSYADRTGWMDLARSRMAPLDTSISDAWAKQEATARGGYSTPYLNLADAIVKGDYLNNNPYIDATFNKAADQVQSRINSQFGAGGRTGSGIAQDVMGSSLGNLATDIYGQNYQQERNRQMQALGMLPTIDAARYADANALGNVGQQRMAYQQSLLNAPLTALQQYSALTGQAFNPMGTTSTQPVYGNYGGLGALLGAGAGLAIGGPAGGMLGAQLGGGVGGMLRY